MQSMDDWNLIQDYAQTGSETAFAELAHRHIDWIYSVAIRQVGDPHLAQDVVQLVLVLLARKAGGSGATRKCNDPRIFRRCAEGCGGRDLR